MAGYDFCDKIFYKKDSKFRGGYISKSIAASITLLYPIQSSLSFYENITNLPSPLRENSEDKSLIVENAFTAKVLDLNAEEGI